MITKGWLVTRALCWLPKGESWATFTTTDPHRTEHYHRLFGRIGTLRIEVYIGDGP
jgi:hypothetical protein